MWLTERADKQLLMLWVIATLSTGGYTRSWFGSGKSRRAQRQKQKANKPKAVIRNFSRALVSPRGAKKERRHAYGGFWHHDIGWFGALRGKRGR